jgi:hypothetical protein
LRSVGVATAARMVGQARIPTDENMMSECRHHEVPLVSEFLRSVSRSALERSTTANPGQTAVARAGVRAGTMQSQSQ